MGKLKHAIGRKIDLFAVWETGQEARRCRDFQPAEINISNGMRIDVVHNGPDSLRLGLVAALEVQPETDVPELDQLIADRIQRLAGGLTDQQDAYRATVRDVFRNGRYKPTGRGKPASEYLLRAASEDRFPRINTLVDVCNYLSMASLLPISIWDLDLAAVHAGQQADETAEFQFRLGAVNESYVFNTGGQEIELADLIIGAVQPKTVQPGAVAPSTTNGLPIVNAIKDSQATKTTAATRRVAAAIYAPLQDGPDMSLADVGQAFCDLLGATSAESRCSHSILMPGDEIALSI